MDTPNEYSACIQLIQFYKSYNIGWVIRLANAYTHLDTKEVETLLWVPYFLAPPSKSKNANSNLGLSVCIMFIVSVW
jgi:hypothetical protein